MSRSEDLQLPIKVGFFVCDAMLSTSVVLPMEMLQAATDKLRIQGHRTPLSIQTFGENPEPITTKSGISIKPDVTLGAMDSYDIIYVPALWRDPLKTLTRNTHFIAALQNIDLEKTIICAVGTGVCFLAEAGLLKNKPATTHWYFFDDFYSGKILL